MSAQADLQFVRVAKKLFQALETYSDSPISSSGRLVVSGRWVKSKLGSSSSTSSADAYSSGYAPEENHRLQDKQRRYRLRRYIVWLVENRSG